RPEEPDAEWLVLKQEAAEIRDERLDADANVVEVVTVGNNAIFIVDERFLQRGEMVAAPRAAARIDPQHAHFLRFRIVVVEDGDESELEFRRLERGIALQERQTDDQVLGERRLAATAELVVRLGPVGGLRAD